MKRLFTIALCAGLAAGAAHGEGIDKPWNDGGRKTPAAISSQGFVRSFLPAKKQPASPSTAPKAPRSNFKQPELAVSASPSTTPVDRKARAGKKARTARKARRKAPVRIVPPAARPVARTAVRKQNNLSNGKWWEKTGNPAVFAFRDCAVKYAEANTRLSPPSQPSQLIAASIRSDCKAEFSTMAGVLLGGLGEAQANRIIRELATTTFLPAVKKVVTVAQFRLNARRAIVHRDQQLASAKAQMFACFTTKADRLSVARTTSARVIAEAVIAGCRPQADAFFNLLFANVRERPAELQRKKNAALNETYREAIIRRVLLRRTPSKIKTATGG